jgi:hypothetical protein
MEVPAGSSHVRHLAASVERDSGGFDLFRARSQDVHKPPEPHHVAIRRTLLSGA